MYVLRNDSFVTNLRFFAQIVRFITFRTPNNRPQKMFGVPGSGIRIGRPNPLILMCETLFWMSE